MYFLNNNSLPLMSYMHPESDTSFQRTLLLRRHSSSEVLLIVSNNLTSWTILFSQEQGQSCINEEMHTCQSWRSSNEVTYCSLLHLLSIFNNLNLACIAHSGIFIYLLLLIYIFIFYCVEELRLHCIRLIPILHLLALSSCRALIGSQLVSPWVWWNQ